jgi:NADP-dependent aldehyde dehydrogenase
MLTHQFTGAHLIDGEWRLPAQAQSFTATNPATGQALQPSFGEAGEPDVNAALAAAVIAFDATADLPPRWQAELLVAIADRIMDLGDALLERGEQETALPRARLTGERTRTFNQLKMFAEIVRDGSWVDAVIETADPSRAPAPKPDLRRMLRSRGPVAVFGASNFPFAFGAVGGDTASALAAGCPIIVKGHPSHPGTSELFAAAVLEALEQRKLPLGLFALLQGRRPELSGALVKHPRLEAVGFTGSLKAGRALFDLAAKRERPIPVYAEMGSVNPLVLMPAAIAERGEKIAEGLAGSVLLGGGQFCTKPGLIFTVGGNDQNFVRALSRQIGSAAPTTMLNHNLRESFREKVEQFAAVPGVHSVVVPQPAEFAKMSPALFETDAATWQREHRLHEEAFGPGAVVVHCRDINELLACLEQMEGSLTGTVHVGTSEDPATTKRVLREMEERVGRVIVNGYPTGVEVNYAIVHGGPYPATTDPGTTSVGSAAIHRWVRLVAFQDTPEALLPPALQNANPLGIERLVNGTRTRDAVPAVSSAGAAR